MIGRASTIAAALIFGTAAPAAEAPSLMQLSAVLHDGDRIVGEPKLTVAAGEPARIVISKRPGERFDLSFTALPAQDGSILTRWTIHARSGYGNRSATPSMTVLPDRRSSIEFGEESATARPFRIDFTITRAK